MVGLLSFTANTTILDSIEFKYNGFQSGKKINLYIRIFSVTTENSAGAEKFFV